MRSQRRDFNPKLIIYQIIAIQCLFYLLFSFLLEFLHFIFNFQISYDLIFSSRDLSFESSDGFLLIFAFLFALIIWGSLLVAGVVQKAKKCLDYGSTLVIIHFILTTWHQSALPSNIAWYLTMIIGGVGMVLLAEYLCMKIEMQEIPIAY